MDSNIHTVIIIVQQFSIDTVQDWNGHNSLL